METFENCQGCSKDGICPLQVAVSGARQVLSWTDVKIDISKHEGGDAVEVDPPEAYKAVMVLIGAFIKSAGVAIVKFSDTSELMDAEDLKTVGSC